MLFYFAKPAHNQRMVRSKPQMTADNESFEEFKNSFSYGSRTDLNFKFLKSLTPDEAADFFQELLWKLGDSINDGDLNRLVAHVASWQAQGYRGAVDRWQYEEGPFTRPDMPASKMRLGLLTSTGHFVEGDDPTPFGVENMSQEEAIRRISEFTSSPPTLSEIPVSTPNDQLRARHGGYDIRSVQQDPDVAFPLRRLKELAAENTIGELADPVYSFVGAASQLRLLKDIGPAWVSLLGQRQVEGVVLVPV
jgi:hypothetical protein